MTLDRKDYKSAIPQLEKRLSEVEKIGKDAFNKFEDIAHKTQLDAAEAEKKVLALDYQMDTLKVVTEYAIVPTGYDPDDWSGTTWDTTMPNLDADSFAPTTQYPNGFTLWARSKTYRNDIVVQYTDPQPVELMDGVFTFVNTVASDAGWTTINGDTITTGKITSADGKCYFDLSDSNFQLKNAADLADATSALAWNGSSGTLYVKGELAVGSPVGNTTLGGINSTANTANSNASTALANAADAATKATAYITRINNNGIFVHTDDSPNPSVPLTTGNYGSHITADGMYVVRNGAYVSHFGQTITLGTRESGSTVGSRSVSIGHNLRAQYMNQVVLGRLNDNTSTNIFEVGNGKQPIGAATEYSNAFAVGNDGTAYVDRALVANGYPSGLSVQKVSFGRTIEAESTDDFTISLKPWYRYPLGVVGWKMTGTGTSQCDIKTLYVSSASYQSGVLTGRIRNNYDSQATPSLEVYVLTAYVPQNYSEPT